MKIKTHAYTKSRAQSFVFLTICLFSLFLICGLGIDSGLLYLTKARLERALDAATLAAVANFQTPGNPTTAANTAAVAVIMRNTAAANFSELNQLYAQAGGSSLNQPITSSVPQPNGQVDTQYEYDFYMSASNTQTNGFMKVYLLTGVNGQITQARCSGSAPTHTYFMGFGGAQFENTDIPYSSQANRSPRLIMICADRSGSMLSNGGAANVPFAIANFMSYFDPSNDSIGLVSFGSNGRLEFPLTTNFIYAATNSLRGCVVEDSGGPPNPYGYYESADDSDQDDLSSYFTSGVRRMKFGGGTAADEGLRIATEQLMSNSGFSNPGVQKIVVLFTDGAWNTARTMLAAPGYTNVVNVPAPYGTNQYSSNTFYMPTLTPYANYTALISSNYDALSSLTASCAALYANDTMLSVDTNTPPELPPYGGGTTYGSPREGQPMNVVTTSDITGGASTKIYATNLDVWLPIGAVDYNYYTNGTLIATYVSRLSSMTNASIAELNTSNSYSPNIQLYPGGSNVLIVPGYLMDGMVCNNLDLYRYQQQGNNGEINGYQDSNWVDNVDGTWPDTSKYNILAQPQVSHTSTMRQLVFRNFMNLMTGFVPMDPYDPPQNGAGSTDPNIWVADTTTNFIKPLHPFGEFYPSAAAFFSFNDVAMGCSGQSAPNTPGGNFTTMSPSGNFLPDETWVSGSFSSPDFFFRNPVYTAAPQQYVTNNWNGQIFYFGSGETLYSSGSTVWSSLSTTESTWKNLSNPADEGWITNSFAPDMTYTTSQYTGSSNATIMNAGVYRPATYRGTAMAYTLNPSRSNAANVTGGYMYDDTSGVGNPTLYYNSMAYSSRPTHYYDFSQSQWVPINAQHFAGGDGNEDSPAPLTGGGLATTEIDAGATEFAHLCFWKSMEYAYHLRAYGVTIYSVGFSSAVSASECDVLGEMANASTYVDSGGFTRTNTVYDPTQPVGLFFYATTPDQIKTDFQQIAQAVTGYLSP